MVRRLIPAPGFLDDAMVARLRRKIGRGPHVIEPPPLILVTPERTVAPPGIVAFGCGNELAAKVRPAMGIAKEPPRFHFPRGVADDLQERLVIVDIAIERRDIEIADDQ